MARSYVDIALMEAEGQLLRDVMRLEIDDTAENAEPISTMNPERRDLGSKKGKRRITGTIETRIRRPREYDWHAKLRSGEHFLVVYEEDDVAGERWKLEDLRVTGISKTHGEDSESTERITFLALEHVPEPFAIGS